jgi:hypothetical protein
MAVEMIVTEADGAASQRAGISGPLLWDFGQEINRS